MVWPFQVLECVSEYYLLSNSHDTIRYDTMGEFNVDWKAEYSALSSTRSQKKKLKQPTRRSLNKQKQRFK